MGGYDAEVERQLEFERRRKAREKARLKGQNAVMGEGSVVMGANKTIRQSYRLLVDVRFAVAPDPKGGFEASPVPKEIGHDPGTGLWYGVGHGATALEAVRNAQIDLLRYLVETLEVRDLVETSEPSS